MAKPLFILNGAPYGTEPKPNMAVRAPSWRWHLGKVLFEKSWLCTRL